ncbi:MAG TPA: hypothetical protein VEA63_14090 [Opitutus sp.]|jgi:hypothetical protein|nr:hypothetical protein [Opitutus sp.]
MQKNRVRRAGVSLLEDTRYHRIRLLSLLADVCRKIERLQSSVEARRACREVAASLRRLLANEENGRGVSRSE